MNTKKRVFFSLIVIILIFCAATGVFGSQEEGEVVEKSLNSVILKAYAMGDVYFRDILAEMSPFIPDGTNNAGTEVKYIFEYIDDDGNAVLIQKTVGMGEKLSFDDKIENILEDKLVKVSVEISRDKRKVCHSATARIYVYYPYIKCEDVSAYYGEFLSLNDAVKEKSWQIFGVQTGEDSEFICAEPNYRCEFSATDGQAVSYVYSPEENINIDVTIFIGEIDVTARSTIVGNRMIVEKNTDICTDCDFTAEVAYFELMIGKIIAGCDPKDLEGESFVYEIKRDDGEVFYEVINFDGTSDTNRQYITGIRPGTYTVRELSGWSWEYTSDPSSRETGVMDSYEGKGGSLLDGKIILGTAEEEVTYGHVSFYSRAHKDDLILINDSAYFIHNELGSNFN